MQHNDAKKMYCPELHDAQHVTCCEADDEVEHPVRSYHNSHSTKEHGDGEQLVGWDPYDGSPGVDEIDCESPDEGDGRPSG